MGTPSFESVQQELSQPDVEHFCCIAEDGHSRCSVQIDGELLQSAVAVVQSDLARTDLNETRCLIDYLVCDRHQWYARARRNYHYRNNIESTWMDEFDAGYFTPKRDRRRSSVASSRSATSSARSSATPTPSLSLRRLRPAPSSTKSDRTRSTLGASRLTGQLGRHQRSVSDTTVPRAPSDPGTPSIVAEHVDRSTLNLGSDVASSSSVHAAHIGGNLEDVFVDGTLTAATEAAEAISASRPTPLAVLEAAQDARPRRESSRGPRPSATVQDFIPGEVTLWAPETLHDEVRSLLLQPLPTQKDRGTLYMIQETRTKHVKIGFTMGKPQARYRDIASKSGRALEIGTARAIPGIPYLQLLRLEQLVHADLAQYQRDLPVKSGRTQHEWFEVSLDTAMNTAEFWWEMMETNNIGPGKALPRAALNVSADDVVMTVTGQGTKPEAWALIRGNHEYRIKLWKKVLPTEQKRRWVLLRWVVRCVVTTALLEMLPLTQRTADVLRVLLLILWTLL